MKRLFLGLVAAMVLVVPVTAQAAVFGSGSDYHRGSQEGVRGSLYAAGGTILVSSEVTGDVLLAGGNVTFDGHALGDVWAVGGRVAVLGPVDGDVRLAGGHASSDNGGVTIGNRVGGDVLVFGGSLHLASTATVAGDLYVFGGQAVIDGTVHGKVYARLGDTLSFGSTARVNGGVTYGARQQATIDNGARITGPITYNPSQRHPVVGKGAVAALVFSLIAFFTLVQILAYFGMAALLVWRYRPWLLSVFQEAHDSFWKSVLRGLVFVILVPIGIVLLFLSFVGIIPAVVILAAYVVIGTLAKVMVGMFAGAWLWSLLNRRADLQVTWINAFVGIILAHLLVFIPVIGWIALTLASFAVFGVLCQRAVRHFWK